MFNLISKRSAGPQAVSSTNTRLSWYRWIIQKHHLSRSLITATNISPTNGAVLGADSALQLLRSLYCISSLEVTTSLDHHAIKSCICNSMKMGDLNYIPDELKHLPCIKISTIFMNWAKQHRTWSTEAFWLEQTVLKY